uniref:Anaphase-promoting complex subunit 10 n=1 Tax=Caenorhabditis tropicalis TaxID=1561998 RepID=A0A1I7T4M1_9PELO
MKHVCSSEDNLKFPLSKCNQVVHENDINAVLDEKEPALERYMSIVHRRYLQHKQNKHSIMAALPSSDIKRCPLCRSIYMHEPGCNYVICANSVCNTAFCWHCERPIGRPCSHFTIASNCRLGYTDYERILRSIQLVLDVNFIILWILLPFVYLIAFIYIPIFIIFLVPASLAYDAYRKEKDSHDFLVPIDILTITFRIIIGIFIGLLVSIPFAIGSIVSGFVLIFVYMGFLVIRTVPCGLTVSLLLFSPNNSIMLTEQRFPRLSLDEAERTSSRGWAREFSNSECFKDITDEARITLSSIANCGGVDELLHESSELAWRTNMSPPHRALLTFSKKTEVSYLMLFLDFSKDESYCPQEVRVDLGWGTNDWWHQVYRKMNHPKGWVKIRLLDTHNLPHRVMALQLTVLKNHEKGRDCVIRHLRIIGPKRSRYESVNRVVLGSFGVLEIKPNSETKRNLIMNYHMSIR